MHLPPAFVSDLVDGRELRPVGECVWSVLPADLPRQRYDRRAATYDRVVGSRLYNHLLWGSSSRAYSAFAERAVRSAEGPLLDAGCGSLVFTASAYARANRPLVLIDQSIGMLHAARDRLLRVAGRVPDEILLLQGDIQDLPFRAGGFSTVLCMAMLHLFDDIKGIVASLANKAAPAGQLFLTSLIAKTRVGTRYLSLLHRLGEMAAARTEDQLLNELGTIGPTVVDRITIETEGSMAFIVCRRPASS